MQPSVRCRNKQMATGCDKIHDLIMHASNYTSETRQKENLQIHNEHAPVINVQVKQHIPCSDIDNLLLSYISI